MTTNELVSFFLSLFEWFGVFFGILGVAVFTAAVMITSGFGAWTLIRTWRRGAAAEDNERLIQEDIGAMGRQEIARMKVNPR